jgi:hypothetical protein
MTREIFDHSVDFFRRAMPERSHVLTEPGYGPDIFDRRGVDAEHAGINFGER